MPARKSQKNKNALVPPHDTDAEKSVLGALLIDKDAVVKIVEFLRPKHFYKSAHEYIYQAIQTFMKQESPQT